MTRRRFAMPCSFSNRKSARRYGFQGLLGLRSLTLCFPGLAAAEVGLTIQGHWRRQGIDQRLGVVVSNFRHPDTFTGGFYRDFIQLKCQCALIIGGVIGM